MKREELIKNFQEWLDAAGEAKERETAWEIVDLLEHKIMPLNFTLAETITTLKGCLLSKGIKREG